MKETLLRFAAIGLVNIYSLCRIGLLPLIFLFAGNDRWGWAAGVFSFMVFTDITDGPLAGALGARTVFGANLDLVCDFVMALGVGWIAVQTVSYGTKLFWAVLITAVISQPLIWIPSRYPSFRYSLAFAVAQAVMVILYVGTSLVVAGVFSQKALGWSGVVYLWPIAIVCLLLAAYWRMDDKILGEWFGPFIAYFRKGAPS